jgi:hypothetical protein
MSDTRQAPHVSRRRLLKVLVAAGGSVAASTLLPGKWVKPILRVGVLPVHAQTSQPATPFIASTTINTSYGDGCVTDLSATISPATAGVQMKVQVCNDVQGCQTITATTDAAGQAVFPDPSNPRCFAQGNTTVTFSFVDPALCTSGKCTVVYLCSMQDGCVIQ